MLDSVCMQIVLSVWFVHIFGLKNVANSQWYDVNKNWNVCTCRKGHLFNKLKLCYHIDNTHISLPEENVAYYQSLMNLDGLWEAIDRKLYQMYIGSCHMAYLIEKEMKRDPGKRTFGKNYVERQRQ